MPKRLGPKGYYLHKITGKVGELNIFEFHINDSQTKEVAKACRDAGLQVTATQLRKSCLDLGVLLMNDLTLAASEIVSEVMPVDSGELPLMHVKEELGTAEDPRSRVYVDGEDHYGRKRKRPEEASSVAMYLDTPDRELTRTQDSIGGQKSQGSQTDNWIADAQMDFEQRKQAILKRLI